VANRFVILGKQLEGSKPEFRCAAKKSFGTAGVEKHAEENGNIFGGEQAWI
jgi:hypothetical protein